MRVHHWTLILRIDSVANPVRTNIVGSIARNKPKSGGPAAFCTCSNFMLKKSARILAGVENLTVEESIRREDHLPAF